MLQNPKEETAATKPGGMRQGGRKKSVFGAIRKQKSGRWQASYIHPELTGGNKRVSLGTFQTKQEAAHALSRVDIAIKAGTWKSPEQVAAEKEAAARQAEQDGVTFGKFCEQFLEIHKTRWGTETYRKYVSNYRSWLKPYWGNVPLKQISTPSVSAWLATLDLSGAGYKNPVNFFSRVLNAAHEDFELIPHNPAAMPIKKLGKSGKGIGVKSKRHEAAPLTMNELVLLADEVNPPCLRLWLLLGGLLGLRAGELRGLRRSSFDFEKHEVTINAAATGVGKYLDQDARPKTATSFRVLPIPPALETEIRKHLEDHAAFGRHGLLFPSPRNPERPRDPTGIGQNMRRACKRLGIAERTSHDLRHSAASLLAEAGIPAVTVQAILGHAESSITRRYTHAFQEQTAKALTGLGDAFTAAASVRDNVIKLPTQKGA